jgi:uncharacterized protein YcfJ
MNAALKTTLAVAVMAFAAQAGAQVTFYENDGFEGRSFTTRQAVDDFKGVGFNDRASSVVVGSNRWEVCEDARFGGRCVVLRRGNYASLGAMGLNDRVSSVRMVSGNARVDDNRYAPAPVIPKITFYEDEGFGGRSLATESQLDDFKRSGFNDRASSVVVAGDRWEVCEDARFGGRCVVLRGGSYPSLAAMGLNDRVSSARVVNVDTRIDGARYAPAPLPAYDYQRRGNERLYEANVTSVRAVMGTPEQRCWIEREQVAQPQSGVNVPATIVGAVIGGILGHQVGGGRGNDLATVGGAVAGGAVGANLGRNSGGQAVGTQNVQRCSSTPSQARPDYWDVTYNFRGLEHRVQMTTQPGPTVTVNGQGEPRA